MTDARWRRLLIALWLFAVVQLTATIVMQIFFFGALPGVDNYFTFFPASQRLELTSVAPNRYRVTAGSDSTAYREGARSGGVLDTSDLPANRRFRVYSNFWWPGESVNLTLRSANGAPKHVRLTAVHVPGTFDMWIANAGLAWMLLFAGVIIWRRSNAPQARALSLLLIFFNIGLGFQVQNWITPLPLLDATVAALNGFFFYPSFALFATYAALFALPLSPLRRGLTFAVYAYAMAIALANAVFWIESATSGVSPAAFGVFYELQYVALVLPLLPVILALLAAKGSERQQLVWASLALMPLFLVYGSGALSPDPTYQRVVSIVTNIAFAVAPLGLTYSVVNRRLLDIGFVLNRAAVFSVVSIIVIAVFVLVEWALGGWLSTASHATNLLVAGGLALTLGLSMHQIHHRVDGFVDRAFFSKRRRDQDAILAFSREAVYVTSRDVLLERTEEVLLAHADASSVAILVDDRRGRYGAVSENDSAVLALRAHHAVLDLHGVATAITGDYAFPMVSRGRVLGVLVLGPKRSHESYAPDELEAVLRLAHAVGSALDVLVQNGVADPMLARLDAICETQAAMTKALAALSAVITDGRGQTVSEDPV